MELSVNAAICGPKATIFKPGFKKTKKEKKKRGFVMLWNDWKQDKNQQMRSDKQAEKGGWYQPALRCSRRDERSPAHTHTHIYAVSRFNLRVAPLICLDEENAHSKKKKKSSGGER